MNILVVSDYGLYRDLSFSFVHNQVREYANLGHRVRVIVPIGLGKTGFDGKRLGKPLIRRSVDGLELFYLRYVTLSAYGAGGFNDFSVRISLAMHLGTILVDFPPDVIHAHTLGFDSTLGAWLKEKTDCPLVVTSHGSDCAIPLGQGRGDYLRQCCNQADVVVAVSTNLANKIKSTQTTTPVRTVLNGFNLQYRAEKPKTACSFLQVCNLIGQKRADVTIRAFAEIRKTCPQAVLTIVGQGPQKEALEALCRELQVADAVRFTGQLPNRKVMEEMAEAQFFVMPSVQEGFGIVYLEAMASGCITIGTEGEGISDVIIDGKNGFLVPGDDADAIVRKVSCCLEHPELCSNVVKKGMEDALTLTWSRNAQQYIKIFKEFAL